MCFLMFSCDGIGFLFNTTEVTIQENFLFNVPVVSDTVYVDKQYNIDIRVDLKGYSIRSCKIVCLKDTIKCDSDIISSMNFSYFFNIPDVVFLINAVKLDNNKKVIFKSKPLFFKPVENLAAKYVHPSENGGKLKLKWDEFDKSHLKKYIIERWFINNNFNLNPGTKKYYQRYEVENAEFIDNYYVGEEAEYKISLLNNEGKMQDSWYYKKAKELPVYNVTQNNTGGYKLHFSKCRYYSNFGQYYLTDGYNYNPAFIHSTDQVDDTTLVLPDAKFGDEVRFWIRYLPKQLPDSFSTNKDWYIYAKFLYAQYGQPSFLFETVTTLDMNTIVFTQNGKIFKYNIANNQISDSIVKQDVFYDNVYSRPDGKYIYAIDKTLNNFTIYLWSENFTQNPASSFKFNIAIPPVSNDMKTIMTIPGSYSPIKLAIYDVSSGNLIYTTNYNGSGSFPAISPNGDYYFIYDINYLKLCSFKNNSFQVIWSESDWKHYYPFYQFNRLNNDLCYTWDDNKIFSIRRTSDFSLLNSFSLPLEKVVDIDYFSNKIMGYDSDKLMIYDLISGNLIKAIPANLSGLFSYDYRTVLLNNTIYSNHGIKYILDN